MTTDLVEKCAAAYTAAYENNRRAQATGFRLFSLTEAHRVGILAVIDALADGVSDEMVRAGDEAFTGLLIPVDSELKAFLAAAIRAAKSREG